MRTREKTLKRARSLRRSMTLPEILLWQELRGRKLKGLFFRRQHPFGPYVLDFYCAGAHLAIEVDGAEAHARPGRPEHDQRRDEYLAQNDIRVLRVAASAVLNDEERPRLLTHIADVAAPSTACAR